MQPGFGHPAWCQGSTVRTATPRPAPGVADYLPADEGSEHLGHLICRCEATTQHENAHGTDFPVRFISTLYVLSSMDKNIKAREDNQAAIQDFNKIFWRKRKNIDESAIL